MHKRSLSCVIFCLSGQGRRVVRRATTASTRITQGRGGENVTECESGVFASELLISE